MNDKKQNTTKWLPGTILIYFLATLIIPNVILAITERLSLWGAATCIILPLGIYVLFSSFFRNGGRTIWFLFPLTFLAAFQIVLLYLYGRSVIAVDMFLNLTTTNSSEAAELLGNLRPAVLLVIFLYVPTLIGATWMIATHRLVSTKLLSKMRHVGLTTTIAGIITLSVSYLSGPYSILTDLYPVNVFYNIGLAVDRTIKTDRYYESSRSYTFQATASGNPDVREIVVLVIGETSRAENWQLYGYNRETNPRLSQTDSVLIGRHTLSESNTTHKSVPMLLSPVDATCYDSIYHVKSVVTAFKEAGYSTAFFSNQRHNGSFIDFFANEADTTFFIKETDNPAMANAGDQALLDYVKAIIADDNRKQLIVLHTYGSHFNYNERYDSIDRHFMPDHYPDASVEYRDNLINAYDNTIVATDRFLASLIEILSDSDADASMLYTSDHGEDIYDDSRHLFLHASPLPTIHQITVPMLAWLSPGFIRHHPDAYNIMKSNMEKEISSSRSFFHTALSLGGIQTPVADPAASLLSPDYEPRLAPLYLNDHNRPVDCRSITHTTPEYCVTKHIFQQKNVNSVALRGKNI